MMQEWRTDTEYKVGDRVAMFGTTWTCVIAHKSNVFGNDLFGTTSNPRNHWVQDGIPDAKPGRSYRSSD
jgi:chitodextrinase